jgi:hypothetical protein
VLRRKAYEEYIEKQRKYYDAEFEQFIKILAERKRIANMKRNLPKDESWRLNKGIGGHAHYDRDEMVREFDKKMQMHLDKLD